MAAQDIHAELTAWVFDEISQQCLGQDYGYHIALWPTQAGPIWHIIITARSPLLGAGPNVHIHSLGNARPDEDTVRKIVADALMALRAYGREQLAGANGKGTG